MKFFLIFALTMVLAATLGCSGESFKRATFDSMQNYSREQCLKDPGVECPERESYDDYQRKRREVKSDE